jgi:serralysin
MTGTRRSDQLRGTQQDDKIICWGGRDRAQGNGGDDEIWGGSDRDLLQGGQGDDILKGGIGDDILVGGWGKDTLTGGTGADSFSLSTQAMPEFADVITDFNAVQGDMLRLPKGVSKANIVLQGYDSDGNGSIDATLIKVDGSGGGFLAIALGTLGATGVTTLTIENFK